MKIDIISDLHMDFFVRQGDPSNTRTQKFIDTFVSEDPGDILILAGDISHYNSQIESLFRNLKKIYSRILVVHGNHDMYLISRNSREKYNWDSSERIQNIKEVAEKTGVDFLDGDIVEIDGVRIGGLCGWYDLKYPDEVKFWKQVMNDSNLIYSGEYEIRAYSGMMVQEWDTQKFYADQLKKLKEIAEKGCDILVTHVAQVIPPEEALPLEYRGDRTNMFYYTNNLDILKQSGCQYHIYGHTHNFHQYDLNGIECLCNPLGYPQEANKTKVYQIEFQIGNTDD